LVLLGQKKRQKHQRGGGGAGQQQKAAEKTNYEKKNKNLAKRKTIGILKKRKTDRRKAGAVREKKGSVWRTRGWTQQKWNEERV